MNSKILILILFYTFTSCGVKGDPSPPKDSVLPSLMENYPDIKTKKPINDVKLKN